MLVRTLVVFLGCLSMGRAGIVFDTLSDPAVGNRSVTFIAQYQSFSTSAILSALTDVQVRLCCGTNTDAGSISIDLYANGSNTPGAAVFHIGSMPDSSLPFTGAQVFDFPVSPFNLSASTRYWVGISTGNGATANWVLGLTNSGDIGTTGEFQDDNNNVASDSFTNFQMQVSVGAQAPASAPEPAAVLLAGIGLSALLFAKRIKFS